MQKKNKAGLYKKEVFFPAKKDWEKQAFYTKTFSILHQDDIIRINDLFFFRFNIVKFPNSVAQHFGGTQTKVKIELWSSGLATKKEIFRGKKNFSGIAAAEFKLKNAEMGIYESFPIFFEEDGFGIVQATLVSQLIGN